eukprot:TRINITY_DN42260_c0_g1_i1.p1 TRINITY_DN42260_c0_g1~~TRINITY_DN42260_c0_g1_i1.p1  ORF type:complete len:674 (+),score=127.88 TRINITY_DN42260_c0_g1_i1:168-2189(+)
MQSELSCKNGIADHGRGGHYAGGVETSRTTVISALGEKAETQCVQDSMLNGFDGLRQQFEQRRKTYNENMRRAVAQSDVEVFAADRPSGAVGATLTYSLDGALPPTTPSRKVVDIANLSAIGHSEHDAAKQLIEKQREADEAETKKRAEATRAARGTLPKTTPAPSTQCTIGGSRPAPRAALARIDRGNDVAPQEVDDDSTDEAVYQCSDGNWADWEDRVIDFHRQAEIEADEEKLAEARARKIARDQRQRESVQKRDFEKKHMAAEAAIANESERRKKRQAHWDFKEDLQKSRNKGLAEQHARNAACRDEVRACRARAAARQNMAGANCTFSGRFFLVESTCEKVDRDTWKDEAKAQARKNLNRIKQASNFRGQHLKSRQALCNAEAKERQRMDRQLRTFLLCKEKENRLRDAHVSQNRIQADRSFKMLLKNLVQETLEQNPIAGSDSSATAAHVDVETYRQTLANFEELNRCVREHSLKVRATVEATGAAPPIPHLLQQESLQKVLEPVGGRVHSALERTVSTCSPGDGGAGGSFVPEEEVWGSPCNSLSIETRTGSAAPRLHTAPAAASRGTESKVEWEQDSVSGKDMFCVAGETPAVRRTPPTSKPAWHRVEPIRSADSPLTVRPTDSVKNPFVTANLSKPTSPRSRREIQSLAALRRIRRTGPLVFER